MAARLLQARARARGTTLSARAAVRAARLVEGSVASRLTARRPQTRSESFELRLREVHNYVRHEPDCQQETAPSSCRMLGLELLSVARPTVSARIAGKAMARVLLRAVQHGRGQRNLLPPDQARSCRQLGAADAAELSFPSQGKPLPHARQA